ncbi:MAG: hypothetical protein WAN48_11455 [Actinomycetes bacterium]
MTTETLPAGAMPVEADATSTQSTGETEADAQAPATGTDAALGETGKRALEAERKAAKDALKRAEAAERELETIRTANQSEQERAIAAARKEGATEVQAKADAKVRRAEVRRALSAAGCIDVGLAELSPDFADLTVTDDGEIEDIERVMKSFQKEHPAQFGSRVAGSPDAGTGAGRGALPTYTSAQIADRAFWEANRDDIMRAMAEGRIVS